MKNLSTILEGFFDNVSAGELTLNDMHKFLDSLISKYNFKLVDSKEIYWDNGLRAYKTNIEKYHSSGHSPAVRYSFNNVMLNPAIVNDKYHNDYCSYYIDIEVYYDNSVMRPRYDVRIGLHQPPTRKSYDLFQLDYYVIPPKKCEVKFFPVVQEQLSGIVKALSDNAAAMTKICEPKLVKTYTVDKATFVRITKPFMKFGKRGI